MNQDIQDVIVSSFNLSISQLFNLSIIMFSCFPGALIGS